MLMTHPSSKSARFDHESITLYANRLYLTAKVIFLKFWFEVAKGIDNERILILLI